MKKFLTSLAAFTAFTAAASAADLPRRAPPPLMAPVPVFTWTGFYAGFNAGYGFGVQDDPGPTVVATIDPRVLQFGAGGFGGLPFGDYGLFAFSNRNNQDGFVGGGQIGYNYQFTPGRGVVVGVEADAQYAGFGRNRNTFASCFGFINFGPPGPCGAPGVTSVAGLTPGVTLFNPNGLSSLDYFGTVRGRLGYAFDRVLFYATGGFAYGSGGGRQFGFANTNGDDFKTGYTVGGGVEYALPTDSFLNFFRSSAVTLKVEGLYVNLGNNNGLNNAFAVDAAGPIFAVPVGGAIPAGTQSLIINPNRNRDTEFAVVRAGLNYKFGSY